MGQASLHDALSPAHVEAIGWVITIWSVFEDQMARAIIALSGMNHALGPFIVNDMPAPAMFNTLRELVYSKFPDHSDEFDPIFKGCDSAPGAIHLHGVRNLFAHAVWVQGSKPSVVRPLAMRMTNAAKMQVGELDVAGIANYADQIARRGANLLQFLQDRGVRLP